MARGVPIFGGPEVLEVAQPYQGKQFLFDLSFLVHIKPGNSTVTGIAKQQYYLDIEQTVLDIDLKLTMLMVIKSCSTR